MVTQDTQVLECLVIQEFRDGQGIRVLVEFQGGQATVVFRGGVVIVVSLDGQAIQVQEFPVILDGVV